MFLSILLPNSNITYYGISLRRLLKCTDGKYYTGYSTSIQKCLVDHQREKV